MIRIDRLRRETAETEAVGHYVQALVEGLAPDPSEWEYTGICVDAGPGALQTLNPPRCACGHPIRYVFHVRRPRDGAETHVGSVCVGHLRVVSPALGERLAQAVEELEARIRDQQARARAAAAEGRVAAARADFERARTAARAAYDRYAGNGDRAPRELWEIVASRNWAIPNGPPEYSRPADYVRWYKSRAEQFRAACVGGVEREKAETAREADVNRVYRDLIGGGSACSPSAGQAGTLAGSGVPAGRLIEGGEEGA